MTHPFEAYFLHVNPRHHSLAFIRTGKSAVHHIMMEVFSFDDMGQGYDIALGEKGRVATTMGRHTSDFITSFYSWTPSGFMVEYGWGARAIDPDTWQAYERKEGPSMWGHDRAWLPPEQQAEARKLRLQTRRQGPAPAGAGDGRELSAHAGVCPWWDDVEPRPKTRLTPSRRAFTRHLLHRFRAARQIFDVDAPERGRKGLLGLRQCRHDHLAEQRRPRSSGSPHLLDRTGGAQDIVGGECDLLARELIAAARPAHALEDAVPHERLQHRLQDAAAADRWRERQRLGGDRPAIAHGARCR